MKFGLGATLLIFLTSFTQANTITILSEVGKNRLIWNSNNFEKITYTLKDGGVFGYSEYKVTIKNGSCRAMSRFIVGKFRDSWSKETCKDRTIPDLFERVKLQLEHGVLRETTKFNAEFGFIESFSAEPDTAATDQDWYFVISNFRAVKIK